MVEREGEGGEKGGEEEGVLWEEGGVVKLKLELRGEEVGEEEGEKWWMIGERGGVMEGEGGGEGSERPPKGEK